MVQPTGALPNEPVFAGPVARSSRIGGIRSVPDELMQQILGVDGPPRRVRIRPRGGVWIRPWGGGGVGISPRGDAIDLAREARDRLTDGDVELPSVDLARYDRLFEVPA